MSNRFLIIVDDDRRKRETILDWLFKPHPCKYMDYRGEPQCFIISVHIPYYLNRSG